MKFHITLFVLFLYIRSWAQVGLPHYIDEALKNSPVVVEQSNLSQLSELEIERIKKELKGPTVFATADYLMAPYFNNKKFIDTNPDPNAIGYDAGITNGGLYSALLNVSQPFLTTKTLKAYQSVQNIEQSKYAYSNELVKRELKRSVTQQYIVVYRDQLLIEANENLLNVIEDQASATHQLAKSGIVKQSDVLLVDLEKKSQQSVLNLLKGKKQSDLSTLNATCGLSDTSRVTVKTPVLTTEEAGNTGSFLRLYQLDSLSVEANTNVFASRYRPQMSLLANAGLNAVSLENIQNKFGFSVGVGVSLSIYDGHQKDINRQKAEVLKSSIAAYKKRKSLDVRNNIQKYINVISTLTDNIQTLEDQQNKYDILLKQYKVEVKSGQLSYINYITSLRYYRELKIKLINAQIDRMLAQNELNYWNW